MRRASRTGRWRGCDLDRKRRRRRAAHRRLFSRPGIASRLLSAFLLARFRSGSSSLRGARASRKRLENNATDANFLAGAAAPNRRTLTKALGATDGGVEGTAENERNGSSSYEADEDWENLTEHQIILEESRVDLRNLSLPENYGLDLGNEDPAFVARQVMKRITSNLERRIAKLFANTKTKECRTKIAENFAYYVNAIGKEIALPFMDTMFENTCYFGKPLTSESPTPLNRTAEEIELDKEEKKSWEYQPPRDEANYIDDPAHLNILYGILGHSDPDAVIRLVNALYEEGHTFIVHIDGKETADETQKRLVEFAATRDYVHVLPDQFRVRVNWGGFSMVNATLQVLKYAFAIDRPGAVPLEFHKFAHMAESSYPIRSNAQIRRQLAEYPIDANFMYVIKTPTNPHEDSWQYFVECDDALHRIYRLPPKRWFSGGIDVMTSSQWFVISREFAKYLAEAVPGTLVHELLEYAEHMVVADEQFFGTVLRHTEFCHKHQNNNFLYLEFGKWENSKETEARDPRKCMMPNPDRCGRSPNTIREDWLPSLAVSEKKHLFARKFVDEPNLVVKDMIDDILRDESKAFDTSFEGHGVLIVAEETIHDDVPLCLGLGENGTNAHLVPCFHEGVEDTLAPDWEYGGVTMPETPDRNRWKLGPCAFDGRLERMRNGEIVASPGKYFRAGPLCTLKAMGGQQDGNCLEGGSFRDEKFFGGYMHASACSAECTQIFSFGGGGASTPPRGSIFATVPTDAVGEAGRVREERRRYVCLGVRGRGDMDEEDWEPDADDEEEEDGEHEESISENEEREEESISEDEEHAKSTYEDEEHAESISEDEEQEESISEDEEHAESISDGDDDVQNDDDDFDGSDDSRDGATEDAGVNLAGSRRTRSEPHLDDFENEAGEVSSDSADTDEDFIDSEWPSLEHFRGKPLVTTDCSNIGGVIEWLFIPYVEEEEGEKGGVQLVDGGEAQRHEH